jgi:endonuclease/exonuclease/phosphatase family metal-dependent hydrolase
LFSKRAIRERDYVPPEAGLFAGWIVEADTTLGKIQILNLHLKPGIRKHGGLDPAAFEAVMDLHVEEVKSFFRSMKSDTPSIILGDLNEGDQGKAVQWLATQGYRDVLPEYDRTTSTWEWTIRGFTYKERLDHILYSEHLESCSAEVIRIKSSDHYPVLGVLEKK